ncbi:hypothetical protein PT273_01375 [Orbaceae bacterium ESL0727]|nr:hypothetical protein [Orbaceae bacterium ESL0727]
MTNVDELLAITLSDGRRYTPSTNSSSASNPIMLPVAGQTLADVQMIVPTNVNSIALSSLIAAPYNYWGDDNGDGQGTNGITATGTVSVRLYDANNTLLSRNATLNLCDSSYYRVELSSTAGALTTRYGYPRTSNFTVSNVTYYIKPYGAPSACYAQPNLLYQAYGGANMIGLVNQWRQDKGFIVQDINNPAANFPTTGVNNVFFNLILAGATVSDITYEAEPASSGLHLTITGSGNVAKVTLTGPRHGATPAEAATAVPTTFTLYANTNGQRTKLYSFKLNKWFIASPDLVQNTSVIPTGYNANYCNRYGTGYRFPHIGELTNANNSDLGWTGSLGSQGTKYYTRQIGGGLFAEWGSMSVYNTIGNYYYPNTDINRMTTFMWVDNRLVTGRLAGVSSIIGLVATSDNYTSNGYSAHMCITN